MTVTQIRSLADQAYHRSEGGMTVSPVDVLSLIKRARVLEAKNLRLRYRMRRAA